MATIYYVENVLGEKMALKLTEEFQKNYDFSALGKVYKRVIPKTVKRGDFAQIFKREDRNASAMIFDGEQFQQLADESGDFNIVPPEYLVFDEFPLNHFRDTLTYDHVPFDNTKHRKAILDNIVRHEGYWTSEFKIKGQPVKLFFYTWDDPEDFQDRVFKLPLGVQYYSYGEDAIDFFVTKNNEDSWVGKDDLYKHQKAGWLFYHID